MLDVEGVVGKPWRKVYMTQSGSETLKSLELAIQTELDGKKFYEEARDNASNPLAKSVFTALAREELYHVEAIQHFHKQLKEKGEWPEQDSIKADLNFPGVVKTVFQEAKDAGIPIIFVDRKAAVSDDLYTAFIGSDFVLEGYNACLEMAKLLPDGGKIIELQGTTGADPAIERKQGFEDCIAAEASNLEILDSQTGDFTRALGKEVMEAFLKTYGDEIDGVYAHNDDMAIGAIQAIEEYGLKPGEDVKIVSIDGVRGAFEAMVDGKLNCTVECNPLLGPQFFEAALTLANGGTVDRWIKSNEGIYCMDTAAQELPNRKY